MKTAKEIAQWVIDNRYPKSENEKVSDAGATCKHQEVSKYVEPCYGCNDYSNHQIKGGIVL